MTSSSYNNKVFRTFSVGGGGPAGRLSMASQICPARRLVSSLTNITGSGALLLGLLAMCPTSGNTVCVCVSRPDTLAVTCCNYVRHMKVGPNFRFRDDELSSLRGRFNFPTTYMTLTDGRI